jgi:isoquinoline 1-oxidoreductase beta subunit
MNAPVDLNRRTVLFAGLSAAGGLAIGVPMSAEAANRVIDMADAKAQAEELTAFLVIDPDNTITIRLPHSEMGQGTSTALAMLVAEELDCDWSQVRVEHASANRNTAAGGKLYGGMQTVGSRGLRTSVQMMQQAGASARERLRLAAAERWKVDPAQCSLESGRCLLKASAQPQTLSYGELAAAAALVNLPSEPAIKAPGEYRIVGKWTPRLDTPAKIDGTAVFGIDAKVPGMVYAAVVSAPEFGARLGSVDETEIQGRRGVIKVVKLDDAVAVVADRYWRAKSALDKLKIEWAPGPNATASSAQFDQAYRDALDGPMLSARKEGDAAAALAVQDAKLVEATYEVPYLAHATMEPLNATVDIKPDRVDVWVGTQAPMAILQATAKATGVDPANIHIHNCFLGGGFGRRSQPDELLQAIAVSKAVGKPVKLIWHREQDIRRDRYRPQAAVRFKGAIAADGKPTALDSRIVCGSLLRSLGGPSAVPNGVEPMAVEVIATHAYKIPNLDVGVMLKNTHVPVSFWRSVGASQNTFFLECFIDELAHAAGKDPYQFRRAMLDRPDYLGVLDAMAEKGDWGKPLPPGRGRGMAIVETYGSVTGQVAEVTVGPDGKVKVDRVVAVIDCYHAANPNTIAQQMEGGVVYGLAAALHGEITIKDGAPVQGNFNTYPLLRMAETPKIEVHLNLSGGKTWGGIGEPSVAPIAPAVCNAIFAATGKRVRRLPLKNVDLRQA